jgi:[ribosomal protein S18]-alanine N-acetyltransferase
LVDTLRFERLQETHIPQILDIEKRTNSAPWSERSFRNELEHEHGFFLIAFQQGQIVGYAGAWFVVDEVHITTVAVSVEVRRKGIGKRLMIELLREARRRGMACSTLEVRASNEAAIRMYEQLGYVIAGRRKAYYPDNREDAIVMWLHDLQNWEPPR